MQLKYSKSSQQLIAHRLLVCRRSHPHCRMLLTRGCLGTKGRDLVSQLCMAQSYWTENTRLFGENTLPPSACFCLSPPSPLSFFNLQPTPLVYKVRDRVNHPGDYFPLHRVPKIPSFTCSHSLSLFCMLHHPYN